MRGNLSPINQQSKRIPLERDCEPSNAQAVFGLQGRANAKAFGQYLGIYYPTAGGQVVTNAEGRRFCAFWIDQTDSGQAGRLPL